MESYGTYIMNHRFSITNIIVVLTNIIAGSYGNPTKKTPSLPTVHWLPTLGVLDVLHWHPWENVCCLSKLKEMLPVILLGRPSGRCLLLVSVGVTCF